MIINAISSLITHFTLSVCEQLSVLVPHNSSFLPTPISVHYTEQMCGSVRSYSNLHGGQTDRLEATVTAMHFLLFIFGSSVNQQ